MKLLINLCAHDGIISHNSGVGTIVKRYIKLLDEIFSKNKIEYHINLFSPEYNEDGFGYSKETYEENINHRHTIYQISNGTSGKKFFGDLENWKIISNNISSIINKIEYKNYDKVITILNDPTFNEVLELTKQVENHIKILIPHSTAKIYGLVNTDPNTKIRIEWEQKAFDYINEHNNCYVVGTGKTIKNHLINEYNCKKEKTLEIINGEILNKKTIYEENNEMKLLFKEIKNNKQIILSFGRPEKYKNLIAPMKIGKEMNIKTIIITQEYFKGMPIIDEYKKEAEANNSLLYINKPFAFPQYILNHFEGEIILIVPSEKEIVGLIINEVRKMNKENILITTNNIDAFKDQIKDTYDGIIIDVNNTYKSAEKINKYFNKDQIKIMNSNSQKRIKRDFDLNKNLEIFLKKILGETNE